MEDILTETVAILAACLLIAAATAAFLMFRPSRRRHRRHRRHTRRPQIDLFDPAGSAEPDA
ncbi:MAG TPA: hypothetical protein VGB04_05120 [Allosphingosinicella sp.]|jgi:preprotein translocase subunit YajC